MPISGRYAIVYYTFCGTFIYAICAGFRDTYGIMLPYITAENNLSFDSVSFIIALGQLFFGLMQPVFGYIVLRTSARAVLCSGTFLMLCGLLIIPCSHAWWQLLLSLGVLLPSGTAAASFGIIMGNIGQRFPENRVHLAGGFVAAGIGFGICILSPIIQGWIAAYGISKAIFLLAIPVLFLFPAAIGLTAGTGRGKTQQRDHAQPPFASILREGIANPAYRRVGFAFFTCGFHMALIQTHLFTQLTAFGISESTAAWGLSIYGLGVVAGSVGSGWAITRWSMASVLGWLYSSRCLWVVLLLLPLPPALLVLVIFLLGLSAVATVAPTAGVVQKLFGTAWLATLFGVVYLAHQVGAFCSAWAGGICMELTGSYTSIWYVDIALCLLAGLACFDMRRIDCKI